MKLKKPQLENLPENQQKIIECFDDETVTKIYHNRKTALKYAKEGIMETESKRTIEEIADYMQILAKIVLEKRGILRKS